MHILHYHPHSGGVMHEWQIYHMVDELQTAGYKVTYFNPVKKLGREGTAAEYSEILISEIKQILSYDKIDMFFTPASDNQIEVETVREIRKMGIPTVVMCCDDLSVPFIHKKIAGSFDLVWSTARESQGILRSYGARAIMMPYAANPYLFKPVSVKEERKLGFIGSCYGSRGIRLASIANAGFPVQIYGKVPEEVYKFSEKKSIPLTRAIKSFKTVVPYVYESMLFPVGRRCIIGAIKRSFLEMINDSNVNNKELPESVKTCPGPSFNEMGAVYSSIALSLGSIELHSTYVLKKPVMCIHLREFEAPMCGAVHLTNRFAELKEYFEEDKEMLYYENNEELIDKVRFYLDPARYDIRQKIRQNARYRAENEHTWLKRFERLFRELGIL